MFKEFNVNDVSHFLGQIWSIIFVQDISLLINWESFKRKPPNSPNAGFFEMKKKKRRKCSEYLRQHSDENIMCLKLIYVVVEYRSQKGILCFEILNEKDCQDQKFS